MADILFLVLGIVLLVVGLAGCVLPVIPGPPVSFVGMLVLKFTDFLEPARTENYNELLWIFAFLAVLVTVLDYIVPVWGTKKFGGSKYGTWGAAIGLVIGLFFAPFGLIFGPFIGAVVGELLGGKDDKASLKAGFGSFLGILTGVVLKLIVSSLIAFYFFREVFVG
jgi:uncharacterized protein YqgC (DUF456 family)